MRLYQKKAIRFFLENVKQISVTLDKVTGKSFSEALILASTNQQYEKRLFIELPVQHMKTTSADHGQNMSFHGNSTNNLLSYCRLVDARISASEKDLPVESTHT